MVDDEVYWYPDVNVIRADLDEGVPSIDLGRGADGKPTIKVARSLSKAEVDNLVRQARERHKRPRWRSVPAAIAAVVHHGARATGERGGPTLATGGVLATGAMLAMVVTGSAPLQQQAGGPPITAPQSRPDLDVDPLGFAPSKPLTAQAVRVPAATKGQSGSDSTAHSPGSLAATLASDGVPVAGSHPLKPTRQMVVTSVRNALPSTVPVPSHPVRCVLKVVLRGGKLLDVTVCLH